MKYLVTGGAGFIGSHICEALIEAGNQIIVLDNLSTGKLSNIENLIHHKDFEFVQGTLIDPKVVNNLVSSVDHVIHLAAAVGVMNIISNPLVSLKTNISGTENILSSANHYKKPVLIASSSEIYGKNSSMPLSEESDRVLGPPQITRWSYSEAKAIDESMSYFYFLEHGLEVRIMRLFNTTGPRQIGEYGMVLPRFIESAIRNEDLIIYGTGKQTRSFCHVYDVVQAIFKLLNSREAIGQAFNIGNNQEISISDLAGKVIEITGSNSISVNLEYSEAYKSGFEDLDRRVPDISKAKKYLNWSPIKTIEQIIKDTENYFR